MRNYCYKTLIEAGADKNVRHPKTGRTALIFATIDGRADIVRELLNLGVDHKIVDDSGLSVKAYMNSTLSLMKASDRKEIRQLLKTINRSKIS